MDTWPIFCSSFQLAGHNGRVGEGKDRQELLLQDPFCHGFGVFGFGEFKCRPPFLKTQEMVVDISVTNSVPSSESTYTLCTHKTFTHREMW